jgi:tetratricopeptide (TPR) repeat protein
MVHESDEAIADYTRAIEIQPDFLDAYFGRGTVYLKQGKLDEAFADFNHTIELNPDYAHGYWGRGGAYYVLGDYPKAIADYREYERLTGKLEAYMRQRIEEMEAVLSATPAA